MKRPSEDPRFLAGVQLIERTGARQFRIGHSHEDDGEPTVWYACATWGKSPQGVPLPKGGRISHEAAGALDPLSAVMRLCEKIVDGGTCSHCGRHTIFVEDVDTLGFERMGCVYAWDPELETFRRGCEGDQ